MSRSASRLLDHQTLAGIRDLRLVARAIVEGFLAGEHPGLRSGPGIEFSQYRSYEPGDDPRRVDWRLFGRTDRFFVRESEIDTDVTVRLLLDASASMAHRHAGASKFEYARYLTAALAYLAHRQGDRVALRWLAGKSRLAEPHLSGKADRDLAGLLHALEHLEPAGIWPAEVGVESLAGARRQREVIAVVSDLCESASEIVDTAAGLRLLGHEVVVFQILSADEIEFPYTGDLEFEDLETGQRVRGNARALRKAYLARFAERQEALRLRLTAAGAVHEPLRSDRPLDQALRSFATSRRFMGDRRSS